jgi:hypothetical protein
MLYTEYKWSKGRKRVIIGVKGTFVRGSQSGLAFWKVENLTDEYNPSDWVKILVWDNLSNKVENSPRCTPQLRGAHYRNWHQYGRISQNYREKLAPKETV